MIVAKTVVTFASRRRRWSSRRSSRAPWSHGSKTRRPSDQRDQSCRRHGSVTTPGTPFRTSCCSRHSRTWSAARSNPLPTPTVPHHRILWSPLWSGRGRRSRSGSTCHPSHNPWNDHSHRCGTSTSTGHPRPTSQYHHPATRGYGDQPGHRRSPPHRVWPDRRNRHRSGGLPSHRSR